jgi:phosphoglycerate dehydrogenase-like enzyme
MLRVLVTAGDFGQGDPRPEAILHAAGCILMRSPYPRPARARELLPLVADTDGILAGPDEFPRAVLQAAPRLQVIARFGEGPGGIDVEAATDLGIVLTDTPGADAEAIADLTFALLLAAARQLPAADRIARRGGEERTVGVELAGKTLGILGLGTVGQAVARRATGFRMDLLGFDPTPDRDAAARLGVRLVPLDGLLAASHLVAVHLPLTPSTRDLLDAHRLRTMKAGAILVSTGEGGVVGEAAVLAALEAGPLAGAGLDSVLRDPWRARSLLALQKLVVTPGIAAHTREAMARKSRQAAEDLLCVFRGQRPAHVLNSGVYDRPGRRAAA